MVASEMCSVGQAISIFEYWPRTSAVTEPFPRPRAAAPVWETVKKSGVQSLTH
jgi:hypothetical protein